MDHDKEYLSDNSIKEVAKAAFGFSKKQLEHDYEAAKQTLIDAPHTEIPAPQNSYQNIVAKIDAEVKPVESLAGLKTKHVIHLKRLPRILLIAGLVAAMATGFGILTMANKSYLYRDSLREGSKRNIVWNNDRSVQKTNTEEDAYQTIQQQLDMKPLVLTYMPEEMIYSRLSMDDQHASLEFDYMGNKIYVMHIKFSAENSNNLLSDRQEYMEVRNHWLGQSIPIEKQTVEGEKIEYSAWLTIENVYYYISGIMPEDIFIEIVEGLSLYQ